jgi:putative ABC transport system permease protein
MGRIAIAMLVRDGSRYLGLVVALAFTALVITQQPATLLGVMARTTALIRDTGGVDLWVMDPKVLYVEEPKPMVDGMLYRVRGVPGVAMAAPFYKGQARVRLSDGSFQNCEIIAVDPASFIGAPSRLSPSSLAALRESDAILVDRAGARTLQSTTVGATVELNDTRARVVGLYDASPGFQTLPRLYTAWTRIRNFVPAERKMLSYVLVQLAPGYDAEQVARDIEQRTGLQAVPTRRFASMTRDWFLKNSGVMATFFGSSLIAMLIGIFIAAQTFRNFTIDHIRYFGAIAAMGASFGQLVRMVLLQAGLAGAVATGIGVGAASLISYGSRSSEVTSNIAPWQLGLSVAVMLCVGGAVALLSVRKLRGLEPAAVFRG